RNASGRDAEAGKTLLSTAVTAAEADHQAAADARAAITRANTRINEVNGTSYGRSESVGGSYQSFGGSVSADLSTAVSNLRSARSYMESHDYGKAEEYANAAYDAAGHANQAAINEVAA